ncbi:MAG TPA: tetratricopeptide repeat protein [Methanocella sp.]|uniref:tetratricopeptide repeat protein n=1 Tax=Methanocella sp. TaxID=2052833 RepID=UPI002C170D1A|nr:tetratricopeptide repeat protein [Methanocella sp.]HTY91139.1 tetratricopeptide repeat protein [Methanocella sp.]
MDASKSLNIARRRFQNGNYMLSLKKYQAARKEFEVALAIFEKTDAYKETAEALNNIGITYVKDGQPEEAKGYFVSSYELKKVHDEGGESLFNSLYNIVGLGEVLTPEEFEKYFLEMRALGESMGGEHAEAVAKEKKTYDNYIEAREAERKRQQEEVLARTTPAGALAHLQRLGKPCMIGLKFALQGIIVTVPEFSYDDGVKVRLAGITPGNGMSTGEIEFQSNYDSVREFLEKKEESALLDEAFEHVKKFMDAVALVREDIDFCVGKKGYSVLSITMANAFGEPVELYHTDAIEPVATATLTGEDTMLVNMMLTSKHGLYKMLLLNAKRSLAEENHSLCIIDAVAGFEAFMDLLLKKALSDAERQEYLALENPCLRERLRFLKRLIGGTDTSDSLEHYLGDAGRDMDDVLAYYDIIMGNDGRTIGAYEAGKSLSAVSRAIYNLKALYDI